MYYQESTPSTALQPYIKCYWLLHDESGLQSDFEKIIPDGSPELIIHLGPPFEERVKGVINQQEPAFIYGQLCSSIEIRPSIQPRVAGVKFQPYGLTAFTLIPQVDLLGKRNSIKEVFPNLPLIDLLDKIHSARTMEVLFSELNQVMLSLLRRQDKFQDEKLGKIKMAVSRLQANNGGVRIDELTRSLNMSRRELERKFNQHVGLSPKQLARIYRLQYTLRSASKIELLTHLALDAGFYDQAHFIREFSHMVNETPSNYFNLTNELTEKFLLRES